MAWTLCTSSAAVMKAGTHCNAISGSAIAMSKWSEEAEGRICAECHSDFVTNYSSYDTQIKNQLSDICSSMVGMCITAYDTTGYISREADMIMNMNDDRVVKGLINLKEKTKQRLSA